MPLTTRVAGKKPVWRWRSQKRRTRAARRTAKDGSESRAAVNHPQTVSGRRLPDHAVAARQTMVVSMLTAAKTGGQGEEADAEKPEVHAERLPRPGRGDCGEGWVGCPSGDSGASGDEG